MAFPSVWDSVRSIQAMKISYQDFINKYGANAWNPTNFKNLNAYQGEYSLARSFQAFTSPTRNRLPSALQPYFTYYNVNGFMVDKCGYTDAQGRGSRNTLSTFANRNGKKHATPQYYIYPGKWLTDWENYVEKALPEQLVAGDNIFSPFVEGGSDCQEHCNRY